MKSRNEVSAGGVVYRRHDGHVDVLICKDAGYHKWVLPKGLVGKSEANEEAALREVREEVGAEARTITPLGEPEKYIYTARGVRVFKSVYYFLMEYVSGNERDHDAEMEEVKWMPLSEALDIVEFKETKAILRRAQGYLENNAT
jgi:8-oxo-dGTP pyrophosphatase MutT (NUDIX family)